MDLKQIVYKAIVGGITLILLGAAHDAWERYKKRGS
jgi:hypothetical protein